jgi:ribosomal protein L44E
MLDSFLKSRHPQICKDVTMMGPQSEEQVIRVAQQLDLIYSQSRLLYSILPNAPRPGANMNKPPPSAHADGMIGSALNQVTNALSQVSLQSNASINQATPTSKVLNIQKTNKKGGQKGKSKKERKERTANAADNGGNDGRKEDEGDNKKTNKVKFPCKLCGESHSTHLCPKISGAKRLLGHPNAAQQTTVLSNPFPHPNQQMVFNVGYQHPPQGGNHPTPPQGAGPSHTGPTIYMMEADVSIQTRAKKYETPGNEPIGKEPVGTLANPLQIERPVLDLVLRPPKDSIKKAMHNPNARAAQNYSVVEDLAQAPCAMSILEVLQSCPVQRSTLLSTLGVQDPSNSNAISFSTQGKPRLPPYVLIQIHVTYKGVNIRRTMVDEGLQRVLFLCHVGRV